MHNASESRGCELDSVALLLRINRSLSCKRLQSYPLKLRKLAQHQDLMRRLLTDRRSRHSMFCFVNTPASWKSFASPSNIRTSSTCHRVLAPAHPFATGRRLRHVQLTLKRPPRPLFTGLRITMSNDSTSPTIRIVSAVLIGGFLLGSFLPLLDAFRNSDSGSSQALLDSQLGRIPVFTVTDDTGRPFLTETEDHLLRRGYFFVQPADAEDFLQKVKQDNPDAKVLAVGLDKAVKFLFSKSTPAKSIPETFELFPDDEQASIAQEITDGAFEKTFGKYGVPIFYVDGLAVKDDKAGTPVYPLFFEKSKLDEALANLKKNEPQSSLSETDLQVIDLSQTIKEIRSGANPRLNQIVFVPLTDSLEQLKKLNSLPSS